MRRCSQYLRKNTDIACPIQELSFSLPPEASKENATWARFSVILYPEQCTESAQQFWGFMGDGISSRHAEFCLDRFPFMYSASSDPSLQTQATFDDVEMIPSEPWRHSDAVTKGKIKVLIASWVTSQKPGHEAVKVQDVFLYPKGMCAIGCLARLLVPSSTQSSEAIIFG